MLLALLVGHASIAVHAASHDMLDGVDCKLCISYHNASAGPPGQPPQGFVPAAAACATAEVTTLVTARTRVPFLQRGPPVSA